MTLSHNTAEATASRITTEVRNTQTVERGRRRAVLPTLLARDEIFWAFLSTKWSRLGELGDPSDDLETSFLLSAIEDIVSNQSNGGVAKAMLAAQYTAHARENYAE